MNTLKEKLLTGFIINTGILSERALQRLISEMEKTNKMLSETAFEMGFLSKEERDLLDSIAEIIDDPKEALRFAVGLRKRLGELLVLSGKITKKELNESLKTQKKTGEKLGEILTKRGYIKDKELKSFLVFQALQESREFSKRFRIGEILVSRGIITEQSLKRALEIQRLYPNKRLGEILVEFGYLTPEELKKGLRLQEKIISLALGAILIFSNIFSYDYVMAQEHRGAKTTVQIIAKVKGYAKVNIIKQLNQFKITREDLVRGYVDIMNATEIEVKTNMRQVFINFEGIAENCIEEIEVLGLPEPAKINPAGGLILMKNPPRHAHFKLSYKLKLNERAKETVYAWPYKVSVFY